MIMISILYYDHDYDFDYDYDYDGDYDGDDCNPDNYCNGDDGDNVYDCKE